MVNEGGAGTWSQFYNTQLTVGRYLQNLYVHSPLIGELMGDTRQTVLEVGAGSGSMSTFLSQIGYEVISVDNDQVVLAKAEGFCRQLNGTAHYVLADAFNLGEKFPKESFRIAFSQGLLEHFAADDVRKLLDQQLQVAHEVVFSVPYVFYPQKDFGNERLLSVDAWRKILAGYRVQLLKPYAPGYFGVKKTLRNFLMEPRLPLIKPCHLLVRIG